MPSSFPRRGEVWLVSFPDDPKCRPALIVSPDARNELANSVLAVPLTTNLRSAPTHMLVPAGQCGLDHDSMARCENVSYIHKPRLQGSSAGTLRPPLMREIERCFLRAFGLTA